MALGDRSIAEYSTTVKDISESSGVNESVNVAAFATLLNPTEEIHTQFGVKRKRNVEIHDETQHIMRLSLWNNHIALVKANGNYKFKDLRVKCFHGKYLTSTVLTVIQPALDAKLTEREVESSTVTALNFPPISIDRLEATTIV